MSTQLAQQYLSRQHPFGIYLVAWFSGSRWIPDDGRQANCQRRDVDTVRTDLAQQACSLKASGYRIAPVILDCSW